MNATGLPAVDGAVATLELDQSPSKIEVPLNIAETLAQSARSTSDARSTSRRGAHVQQGESAEAAVTRAGRVATIAEQRDD